MQQSILAGVAYFVCVFAAAFPLGVVRTILMVPLLGETLAVVLELPIILLGAWLFSAWLTHRLRVPARLLPRLLMGAVAFSFLLTGEALISLWLADRNFIEHFELYCETPQRLGFAGQVAFALFPLLQALTIELPAEADR